MRKSFNILSKDMTSCFTISILLDLIDMENASNARYKFAIIIGT